MSRHFEMGVSSVVSWLLQFGGYQSHKCNDLTQSTWFGNPWEKSSAMQKGSELGKFGRFKHLDDLFWLRFWTRYPEGMQPRFRRCRGTGFPYLDIAQRLQTLDDLCAQMYVLDDVRVQDSRMYTSPKSSVFVGRSPNDYRHWTMSPLRIPVGRLHPNLQNWTISPLRTSEFL